MAYTITSACVGCGACQTICPTEAISGQPDQVHTIDPGLCSECGACGRACPQEAIVDQTGAPCIRKKKTQWDKPVFDQKKCCACSMCIDACPTGCLGLDYAMGKNKHGVPYLKQVRGCVGCGLCSRECPMGAVSMITPDQEAAL